MSETAAPAPDEPSHAFLHHKPKKRQRWPTFADQYRDQLLRVFAPGRSLIASDEVLFSRGRLADLIDETPPTERFVTWRGDNEIYLVERVASPDEFIVVPKFRLEVKISGIDFDEIPDRKAYEIELAKALAREVASKFPKRAVALDVGRFRTGSIELVAGIGLGAGLMTAFGIVKDYPNFKKGAKEIATDIGKVAKRVTKRSAPGRSISVKVESKRLPAPGNDP